MRAYAVIPPILLDEKRRSYRYVNKNGLVEDPMGEYKEQKNVNIWTEQETEIFKDKYLQHPKNFVVIASYLERKSVADCIQNYYLTKKKENYKCQVKRRMRTRRKGNAAPPTVENLVAINSTGVTTRGSAAAAHQKELLKGSNGSQPASSGATVVVTSADMIVTTTAQEMITSGLNIVEEGSHSPAINGTPIIVTASSPSMNWTPSTAFMATSNDQLTDAVPDTTPTMRDINSMSISNVVQSSENVSSPRENESIVASTATISEVTPLVVTSSNGGDSSVCQEVREKDKENLALR